MTLEAALNSALAGILYTISMAIVVLFQISLSLGAPWGAASMGGKFPGKYPPKMRVVALLNALFLSLLIVIVDIRAGMLLFEFKDFSYYAIWFVVAFSAISVLLNSITNSKIERIWIPFTIIHFITSLVVALS
jgi:hypothetical protein